MYTFKKLIKNDIPLLKNDLFAVSLQNGYIALLKTNMICTYKINSELLKIVEIAKIQNKYSGPIIKLYYVVINL